MSIPYIVHRIRTFAEVNIKSLSNVLNFTVVSKEQYSKNQDVVFTTLTTEEWYILVTNNHGKDYFCSNTLKPEFLDTNKNMDQKYILNYCVDCLNLFFGIRIFLEEYNCIHEKWLSVYNIIKYFLCYPLE